MVLTAWDNRSKGFDQVLILSNRGGGSDVQHVSTKIITVLVLILSNRGGGSDKNTQNKENGHGKVLILSNRGGGSDPG